MECVNACKNHVHVYVVHPANDLPRSWSCLKPFGHNLKKINIQLGLLRPEVTSTPKNFNDIPSITIFTEHKFNQRQQFSCLLL